MNSPDPAPGGVPITDVRSARENLREDVRRSVLLAAAQILLEEGPTALTVRRVADAVNASTKVVYTLFGGKDGLLDALYLHSFARFADAFAECRAIEPPARRLAALCQRYRAFACAEPALYQFMFGDLGRAYQAPLASRKRAWKTFEVLAEALAAASGETERSVVADGTRVLWAAMHGCVSLELRGLMKDAAMARRIFEAAVRAAAAQAGIGLVFPAQPAD